MPIVDMPIVDQHGRDDADEDEFDPDWNADNDTDYGFWIKEIPRQAEKIFSENKSKPAVKSAEHLAEEKQFKDFQATLQVDAASKVQAGGGAGRQRVADTSLPSVAM